MFDRSHRSRGRIAHRSGAAAVALKARAAAWDLPLVETDEGLCLFLWNCELRLMPEGAGLRIDLAAPDQRMLATLRDSASELFDEAGLAVAWDHVDTGALAPGLSLVRVLSVMRRSPGFLRIRLRGADMPRFAQDGLHFRLLIPPPGRAPVWPRIGASGRTIWPDGADAMHRPVYTLTGQDQDWLDFDAFAHADSPTCDWALAGPQGQQVGITGPGGGWCPDARRLFLFGDQTALPAIARMLVLARGRVRAVLRCAPEDMGPLANDRRVIASDDLLGALALLGPLDQNDHVWFAGPANEARSARRMLRDRGLDKTGYTAAAYWG
ncbi:MAG: siderophore-interacting protein [Paracoccus sp.]|nr:siderophore-interacting protein [Paracoccus sp. (in: a-proteobacteria)]